ncbi:Uncharacterized protein SCF082_LOCUS47921 [Durusdinium trenchii]
MGEGKHFVFSTNRPALCGYADTLVKAGPTHTGLEMKLFHFSEQKDLDTACLEEQLSLNGAACEAFEVSVLLLATASSSYLWFDQEHCPNNVRLCRILTEKVQKKINLVICPTTKKAEDSWNCHPCLSESIFGDFMRCATVRVWNGFRSDAEQVKPWPICSLALKEGETIPQPSATLAKPSVDNRLVTRWLPWLLLFGSHLVFSRWVSKVQSDQVKAQGLAHDQMKAQGVEIQKLQMQIEAQGMEIQTLKMKTQTQDVQIQALQTQQVSAGSQSFGVYCPNLFDLILLFICS